MKRLLLAIMVLISLLGLTGCIEEVIEENIENKVEEENTDSNSEVEEEIVEDVEGVVEIGVLVDVHYHIEYMDFDKALNDSWVIVNAEVIEHEKEGILNTYTFSVNEYIKRSTTEDEFVVLIQDAEMLVGKEGEPYSDYFTSQLKYEVGESYILVLQRSGSVYDGERFMIVSDIYIPVEGEVITKLTQYNKNVDIDVLTVTEFMDYVNHVVDPDSDAFNSLDQFTEYVDSNYLTEIINGSKYIVKVKIKEMIVEGYTNRDTFDCIVLHEYFGELTTFEGNTGYREITVPIFKGTVEAGEEYIILLNDLSEGSTMYSLSSRNSVYLPTNEELLDLID